MGDALTDNAVYRTVYRFVLDALGPDWAWLAYATATLALVMLMVNVVMGLATVYTWAERRLLGRFTNRLGPNRAGPFGLLQPIADAVKLLTKEDIVPRSADRLVFNVAPVVMLKNGPPNPRVGMTVATIVMENATSSSARVNAHRGRNLRNASWGPTTMMNRRKNAAGVAELRPSRVPWMRNSVTGSVSPTASDNTLPRMNARLVMPPYPRRGRNLPSRRGVVGSRDRSSSFLA